MDAYDEMARLRAATGVKISGGELNSGGLPEFRVMVEKGCYDWYQPDACFTGGVAETWQIVQLVTEAGATFCPHTWTNGVGFAINLQLYAASPARDDHHLEYPYDPPGWVPEVRDGILRQPFLHERGRLKVPTLPGLGFEIDARALRRHGSHFFTATPARVALRAVLDKGLSTAKELGATRSARLAARDAELAQEGVDPALDALPLPR